MAFALLRRGSDSPLAHWAGVLHGLFADPGHEEPQEEEGSEGSVGSGGMIDADNIEEGSEGSVASKGFAVDDPMDLD
jgi:hypothetical protein